MLRNLTFMIIVGSLLLVACGEESDKPQIEGANSQSQSTNLSPSPSPFTAESTEASASDSAGDLAILNLQLENITGLNGQIVFTYLDGIYQASLETGVVEPVVEDVSLLDVAPNGRTFVYRPEDDLQKLMAVTLDGDAPFEIATIDEEHEAQIGRWSPDQEWFGVQILYALPVPDDMPPELTIYEEINHYLVHRDGHIIDLPPQAEEGKFTSRHMFWLEDGMLLVAAFISDNLGLFGDGTQSLWVLDLRNDTVSEVDLDEPRIPNELFVDVAAPAREGLQMLLEFHGMILAEEAPIMQGRTLISPDGSMLVEDSWMPSDGECSRVVIVRKGITVTLLPETVYDDFNTIFMSNLAGLEDGSVVFSRWVSNSCARDDVRHELIRLDAFSSDDPTPQPLHEVATGSWMGCARCVVMSPDERYVIWVNSATTDEEAHLLLTDLETQQTSTLMSLPIQDVEIVDDFNFGNGSISRVYWVE